MHKPFALAFLAPLPLIALGCSSSSNSDLGGGDGGSLLDTGTPAMTNPADATVGSTGSTPLPCDVNAIVVPHCQACHGSPTQNGAPMSLVTWEDFQALTPKDPDGPAFAAGSHVYQTAQFRIGDDQAPMPQPPNARLDAADTATMNSWLSAGAPKTDGATCSGDASVSVPDAAAPTLSCTTNGTTLEAPTPWTMPAADSDDYVCYSVPLAQVGTGTNHVLGITPKIDNHSIVHHVLLFEADSTDMSVTSTPTVCNPGGSFGWRVVYAWAPGGGAMQTPPEVGFPYDSTTKWIVQVHYNNAKGLSGQTDNTGFSLCTTDQPVKYDADVVAFGTENIAIPPRSALDETCSVTVAAPFAGVHAFAAFPHMHLLGQAIQTEQTLAAGGLVGMAENAPWDFNAQVWFPLDTTLNAGDVVSTRCAWQNSTDSLVTFGPDTENEMCYSFTAYYPKVTSSTWQWDLPASGSSCTPSADGGLPAPDGGWASGGAFGSNNDGGASAGED